MKTLLEKVNSPADIKILSLEQLNQLAAEVRKYMLQVVSKTGGHLSANLGVVELTIALHRSFDLPLDKLVWDVGHQCYAHKILTGRREEFANLRQLDGLSGFPKPNESPYDIFSSGHSSTSISVALGLAEAALLAGEEKHVVAVLGDGALTGGMVYEAMNHAGGRKTPLIVILNDNELSIAKNVGSISVRLTKLRKSPRYKASKKRIESFLRHIPQFGPTMAKSVERMKNSFKYLLVPGMLFEDMGFTYIGPINGHDIPTMLDAMENAKQIGGPVLLHVITKKGLGYLPAQSQPQKFHGVGAFNLKTGEPLDYPENQTFTQAFSQALLQEAKDNQKVVAITAAMADGTGLTNFAKTYPERFFDVGIAEQHAIAFAAGLATAGNRPVVALYSTFLQRAYDQLLQDVCLPNLPVTIAVDRAGLVGEDGETHQGIFDITFLRSMPNLLFMAPKDGAELKAMLHTALNYSGPSALRYLRGEAPTGLPAPDSKLLPIGKAEILQEGSQVAILAVGPLAYTAMEAAEILAKNGLSVLVANLRFINPLDEELLSRVAKEIGRVAVLEENILAGGVGSTCLETWQKQGFLPQVELIALPNQFIPQGPAKELKKRYGLDAMAVSQRILDRWVK